MQQVGGALEEEAVFGRLRALPVPVREMIAGGAAAGIAKSFIAPLERCKILFQTGKLQGAQLGPTLAHIYETEGVRGLFRGNGASVLRIIPYASTHFLAYEHYRRMLVGAGILGALEHRVPPSVDLLAGSAAGATAVMITYPLDLVRTRLAFMTEAGGRRRQHSHSSVSHAAASTSPHASPAFASAAASRASSSSSSSGLPLFPGRAPAGLALASSRGCSSGGGSSLAGSGGRVPASLAAASSLGSGSSCSSSSSSGLGCNGRLQGRGPQRLLHVLPTLASQPQHTIRSVLSSTLRKEGVRGLYHGVGASLYGILPYAGLKFYVYQHLKQSYHHMRPGEVARTGADGKPRLPVPVMLSFGATAGLVAQTLTYPLDVVRRQMQVEGLKLQEAAANSPTRQLAGGLPPLSLRSTPQALVLLAQRHGWRCLYAGLSINYLKVIPSTAIGFTIYDYMKSALALPTNL